MKAKIQPTQNIEQLKENLKKQVQEVDIVDDKLVAEVETITPLENTPGIKSFQVNDTEHKGLKGRPVQEKAYAKIESREDVVRALLATVQGYDLVVLNTERRWDLRQLKKYNPDIKVLNSKEPAEELQIKKTISDIEGLGKIDIEMPDEEELNLIYHEMLT